MNQTPVQQLITLSNHISNVVGNVLLSVLGIQLTLLALPVYTGDKRFN